jgi:Fur family ferric uptake transcriptional regulator
MKTAASTSTTKSAKKKATTASQPESNAQAQATLHPSHAQHTQAITEAAERIFREFLRKKGYRATPERDAVLREIYSDAGHFDADELFIRLKQKKYAISRATVYNTLELLVECNLVSQNSFGHKHLHYERTYGYEHHDHIVCNQCGEVFEFTNPQIEEQQQAVCRNLGFEIRQHTLQIFADCTKPDCEYKKRMGMITKP